MSNNSPLPFGCLVGLLKKSISDAVVDPDTRNRVTSDILTNAFKQVDAHFRTTTLARLLSSSCSASWPQPGKSETCVRALTVCVALASPMACYCGISPPVQSIGSYRDRCARCLFAHANDQTAVRDSLLRQYPAIAGGKPPPCTRCRKVPRVGCQSVCQIGYPRYRDLYTLTSFNPLQVGLVQPAQGP